MREFNELVAETKGQYYGRIEEREMARRDFQKELNK